MGIIGDFDVQHIFDCSIPRGRHVADRQLAREKLCFKLCSQHDVEVVGQLISLNANQARLGSVDRSVEVSPGYL